MKIKAQEAAFHCKCNWAESAGKPSKYFFALEKAQYNKKVMSQLQCDNGDKIDNPNAILNEQARYYVNLYTCNANVEFKLRNNGNYKLNSAQSSVLDCDISLEELTTAIKTLKCNKSPGGDGLTLEFYQFFWCKFKHVYHAAIQWAIRHGTLHASVRKGIIMLIPKKKDPLLL